MKFEELLYALRNNESTLSFCENFNLIPRIKYCDKCGHLMKKKIKKNVRIGIIWRCASVCKKETSILHNTFFENSKIEIKNIIKFIYFWSYEICSFKLIKRELDLHEHAYVDFRSYLREVCSLKLFENSEKLGGPGKIVEIDESLFTKRKYNVGRFTSQQWVFGGIERGTKKCFLVPVQSRSKVNLMSVIHDKIESGTTIISDCWKSYNDIATSGFNHLTVNHTYNFVDPISGAHTNNIERLWGKAKQRNKKEYGTVLNILDSYLEEFMWREIYNDNCFINILTHISEIYNGN